MSRRMLVSVAFLLVNAVSLAAADAQPIIATPFTWRAEEEIPRRMWLYGKHLLRRFVSVDVAAGGTGKSSVKIGEALAMASS